MINSVYGTLRRFFYEGSKMFNLLGLMAWNSSYKKSKKWEYLSDLTQSMKRNTLKKFVCKLKEKTNSELKGAGISDLVLKHDNFVEFDINFYKKEPDSLDEQDKEKWYYHLMKIAKHEFGMDHIKEASDLYRGRIFLNPDEPGVPYRMGISLKSLFTGENLYDVVKKGFEQTKDYANRYLEEVERDDKHHSIAN